ncbi:MAG: LapA family protein [Hyphomicrobiales bacterium]|nr:LapA family protein [Hyphomicrobiales bacterium]
MRGLAKAIILVPLALLAVAFAVGNRGNVSVSFDPLSETPSYTIDAPLFVVVFAAVILGVLMGGMATWLGQGRYRRAARMHRRDVERLRSDLDRIRQTSSAP